MTYRYYTTAERKMIEEWVGPLKPLAQQLGRSTTAISHFKKRYALPQKLPLSSTDIAEIQRLRKAGVPREKVAEMFMVCPQTVTNHMRGIPYD